jgi:phosphatidylglycerophosphate synthase
MSHNTWIHRCLGPVLVKPLARTPVTPNHLTALRLATGLAAAVFLAMGEEAWRDWGAGLFVVSFLLDRADGSLARMTGKTSPLGHTLDLIGDSVCNTLIFVGLGIGLVDGAFGWWALPLGVLAGAAVAFILWMTIQLEQLDGERAGEMPNYGGFDADDGVLGIPILIWLGWPEGLLVAAAICAPAFALAFLVFIYRKRSAAAKTASRI